MLRLLPSWAGDLKPEDFTESLASEMCLRCVFNQLNVSIQVKIKLNQVSLSFLLMPGQTLAG